MYFTMKQTLNMKILNVSGETIERQISQEDRTIKILMMLSTLAQEC